MIFVVIVVVIVIAIGTIGFVMYDSSSVPPPISATSSTSSTSSTSTSISATGSPTSYSTSSASGLDLQIALNATTVEVGTPLSAQISLSNTLTANLSLAANYSADTNVANWNNYDSLCGLSSVADTFGFALFQGHYTAGNFSQAGTPVLLTPPVETYCPNTDYDPAYVQTVEFAPDSNVATLSTNASFSDQFKPIMVGMEMNATTGSCIASPYKESGTSTEDGTTTVSSGTELSLSCGSNSANSLNGYWTAPGPGLTMGINSATNSTIEAGINGLYGNFFHQFLTGPYTIVAEDMWNQTVFAHFEVAPGPTTTTTTSFECTITGQPGPIFVRVLSDSNQTPVAGAVVKATNNPAYCGSVPAAQQETTSFTTTASTQWYSLNSENNAGYSLVVTYQGQTYTFTANLRPLSATCATIYVPSGRTSVSIEGFETSCASTSTSTTSSSSQQVPASLTWYSYYGVWTYTVTLTTNQIQQGESITAVFQLMNTSNQTQMVDVVDPLVNPVIYSQSGTVVWAWNPSEINQVEGVAAGRVLSLQMTLPTSMLKAGQSYILSTYPGFGTPDFTTDFGPHLQQNETITVA